MNTDFIKGVIVPILTPVDENEMIDENKLREHYHEYRFYQGRGRSHSHPYR